MLVVGFAFIDGTQDSDAVEDGASTYHVKFTTSETVTGTETGTAGNPFIIRYTSGYSAADTFPSQIEDGDTLIVDGIDDIASQGGNTAPQGRYGIHKNVTIQAGDSVKDTRWNVSLTLCGSANVTMKGFLFGELYIETKEINSVNDTKITLDHCRFILDNDSVNYTDNPNSSSHYNRYNIKNGPGADITILYCEFNNNISNETNRGCGVYSYGGADKIDMSGSSFDGYNHIMNAVSVADLNVYNNKFLNIRQFSEEDEGHVIRISGNMNNASISNNTATSVDGLSNIFLKISSGCNIDEVSLSGNNMTDFGYGIKYTPNDDETSYSETKVNAEDNTFIKNGNSTQMEVDTGGRDGMIIETDPILSPSEPSTGDDDDEYPFLPGNNTPQASSDSDKTTLVAAAAAVVVIMLAVVALMVTRNN